MSMKADKAVSPTAEQIARILITSTRKSGDIFTKLRELVEPYTSEEADKIAAEARAAWRKAGYDRKVHGQSHADTLLSLILRCKREGINPIPNSQAECKAALKALTAAGSGNKEGEEEAADRAEREAAEKAKQAGREKIAQAVEDLAIGIEAQPADILALAKLAIAYRDVLAAVHDAEAAGVARVTITASIRTLQRDQQAENRRRDDAEDAEAGEPALLESEAA